MTDRSMGFTKNLVFRDLFGRSIRLFSADLVSLEEEYPERMAFWGVNPWRLNIDETKIVATLSVRRRPDGSYAEIVDRAATATTPIYDALAKERDL